MSGEGRDRFWHQSGRFPLIALSAVLLLLCLYARWRLLDLPLERDEGEFAYMGQLLLKGVPPYLEAYTLKLPGVSAAYALLMLLFGQTPFGIHLGLLLVNLGSILLVGLLASRLFEPPAALAAATCYALLSLSQGVAGAAAHATHFVVLFALAGFLLLLRHFDAGRRLWPLLGGGFCLGLAITMKQHAVLLAGFALAYYAWRARRHPGAGNAPLVTGSLFLLAIALPLLLVVLVMMLAGTFAEFWFWTVRYALDYAGRLTLAEGVTVFTVMFPKTVAAQLPWWLLAAAGSLAVLFRPQVCRDRLLLFGLLIFSFLAASAGFYFRGHYFILLLPVVALLVAAAVVTADAMLAEQGHPAWLRLAVPCLLVALSAGYGIYRERAYLLQLSPPEVSRLIYDVNPFPESLVVARYLREHTLPTERIAVLGSEPQIYFYADRRSASRHIYMYGLTETHQYAAQMQRELIDDLEAAQPKYLVFVGVPASWLVNKEAPQLLFEWVDRYLEHNYLLAGTVDIGMDRTVYNFDPTTVDADLLIAKSLLIYRRKT